MISFQQYIREMYNEPDDSEFTDNGHEYDLNGILSATLGMPVQNFPVSDLKWIFNYDDPFKDPTRVEEADLSAPILITQEQGVFVVVDGLHRLGKAVQNQMKTIPAIIVSTNILDRYRIKRLESSNT